MEPFSITILVVIGIIGWSVNLISLAAAVPFSPIVFPIIPIIAVFTGVYLYPRFKLAQPLPSTLDELPATWRRKILNWLRKYPLYLVMVPGIILLIFLPSLQFGYHGPFHTAYAYQIMNRGVPPENVTLPGFPANDYWPYHALLAILSRLFNAPPPFISALLNITMLVVAFFLLAALWKALLKGIQVASAFDVIFSLLGSNLLFFLNPIAINWLAGIPSLKPISDWLSLNDYRLVHQYFLFLNFSGFPIGVALFLACLILAERIFRKGLTVKDGLLFIFFIISALLCHVTTGIFLLIVLAPTLLVLYFKDAVRRDQALAFWKNNKLKLLGLTLLAGLAFLPAGIFVLRSSRSMPAKTTVEWFSSRDLATIFVQTYPVAIFFILGIVRAWKKSEIFILFLSITALWGLLLSIIVKLPDNNEYKFIFLASVCVNIVAVYRLREMTLQPRPWKKFLLALFVIAIVYKVGYATWGFYDKYTRRHKVEIVYDHTHVTLKNRDFAPFEWIRDNTPLDAVIIQPLTSKDWNYGYFSERLPFVLAGHIYNDGIPETARRIDLIEILFNQSFPVEARVEAVRQILQTSLQRPLVLIYPFDNAFDTGLREAFEISEERLGKNIIIYVLPQQ